MGNRAGVKDCSIDVKFMEKWLHASYTHMSDLKALGV
jgi:hypothetical protein